MCLVCNYIGGLYSAEPKGDGTSKKATASFCAAQVDQIAHRGFCQPRKLASPTSKNRHLSTK